MKQDLTEMAKQLVKECHGFIEANNYEILKVEENYCELEGILSESSLNNLGVAHGGYIFGLADTAAGIAAMTNGGNVVTVDSNISYFKPAKGDRIIAKANAIKVGKTISVFEVEILDEKSDMVARATMTFYNIGNNEKNK